MDSKVVFQSEDILVTSYFCRMLFGGGDMVFLDVVLVKVGVKDHRIHYLSAGWGRI